jgi:uncharacterized membrane protein
MSFYKKGQNLIVQAGVFLVLWLIASLVWAIWLDGIYVPAVGCMTALAVIGVLNFGLHFHR